MTTSGFPQGDLPTAPLDLTRRDRILVRYWCDLFQVCILLFLFGVYMLAPQASGAKMAINPVPAIVALFIAATILRLFLNFRQIGFQHIQYLWIVIDFACLYALLVAYHIQYETGAGAILGRTEKADQTIAHALKSDDAAKRDEGYEQAIFDRGGSPFVPHERAQKPI